MKILPRRVTERGTLTLTQDPAQKVVADILNISMVDDSNNKDDQTVVDEMRGVMGAMGGADFIFNFSYFHQIVAHFFKPRVAIGITQNEVATKLVRSW